MGFLRPIISSFNRYWSIYFSVFLSVFASSCTKFTCVDPLGIQGACSSFAFDDSTAPASSSTSNNNSPQRYAWDFDSSSSYTFNSDWVSVSSGLASLLNLDQTDSDETAFDLGTYGSGSNTTQWSTSEVEYVLPRLPGSGETGVIQSPSTLVLHFDEPAWTGAANEIIDSSPLGNTGTLTSATNVIRRAGLMGSAAYFNGSGYITMNNESYYDFDGTDAFSISAWIRTSSGNTGIVTKYQDTGTGYALYIDNTNTLSFWLGTFGVSAIYAYSSVSVIDGLWHHVVGTYNGNGDSSGITIYVDGIDVTTNRTGGAVAATLNNLNVVIGAYDSNGMFPFTGFIDEVGIWDQELTSAEIATLYESQTGAYSDASFPDSASTSGWVSMANNELLLHFDESSYVDGGAVSDNSGNGRDATIHTSEVGTEKKVGGKLGYGIKFDGADDYLGPVTPSTSFSAHSFSSWIKMAPYAGCCMEYVQMTSDANVIANYEIDGAAGGFDGGVSKIV